MGICQFIAANPVSFMTSTEPQLHNGPCRWKLLNCFNVGMRNITERTTKEGSLCSMGDMHSMLAASHFTETKHYVNIAKNMFPNLYGLTLKKKEKIAAAIVVQNGRPAKAFLVE